MNILEFIGWLLLVIMSVGSLFAAYIIVASSAWNGKVEKIPLMIVLVFSVVLWYLTFTTAPFTISFN